MAESVCRPEAGVPLAESTTLGVGGPARWFVRASGVAEVAAAHRWNQAHDFPLTVLGGGSNVVVADRGIDGLVLHMTGDGVDLEPDGSATLVHAAAGAEWSAVVDAAVGQGLAGIECLAGIPGSVGGTPIQNVGAYGQEVASVIARVEVFDRVVSASVRLGPDECGFGYRTSRFRDVEAGRFVVCGVSYRLRAGAPTVAYPDLARYLDESGVPEPNLADVRRAVLAIRQRKGMVLDRAYPEMRSVGSFFANPMVSEGDYARLRDTLGDVPGTSQPEGRVRVPAAWLIERSGFERGHRTGTVGVSAMHPLAIVAGEGATARDVVRLAVSIKRRIAERFGVWLLAEPVFLGFGADADVEYLRRVGP